MSSRRAGILAWTIATVDIVVLLAAMPLAYLSDSVSTTGAPGFITLVTLFVPSVAYPVVGAFIASKRPSNAIGWLCLAIGGVWFVSALQISYAAYGAVVHPGALPAAEMIGAVSGWVPAVGLLGTFFLLLFPDGRLPSARWRGVAWASGIVIVGLTFAEMWTTRTLAWFPGTVNPLLPSGTVLAMLDVLTGTLYLAFFACIVASIVSLVLRYRRARADERQKLKWIAFAGALFVAILVISFISWQVREPSALVKVFQASVGIALALLPGAALLAILRHHLYDIDRIISRTVSYTVATAILGVVFVGLVIVLQWATSPLSAGSDVAVAISTLVVFAVFAPVWRRVRGVVDRRFNRARYDAAQTVDAFSDRLREQTDIDSLLSDLEGVVHRTVAPTHLSLWIREASSHR